VHAPERGAGSTCTVYDRRSEGPDRTHYERFPGTGAAEESARTTPSVPGSDRERGARRSADPDPPDGTTNYAHNYPFFWSRCCRARRRRVGARSTTDARRFPAALDTGATLNGAMISVSGIA
jgi:hypothetical protein